MATLTLQPDATAGKDNILDAGATTDNNATDDSFDVIMSGGSAARRGIIQFDLSSIPVGANVSSAILSLWTGSGLTNVNMSIHRVTRTWTEAGSTWNTYDGSNNWTTAGGDYDAAADANATPSSTTAGTQTNWTITSLVQEWVDGTANNGMIVKLTTESGNTTGHLFRSSDNADAATRPKLVITYTPPASFLMMF